MRASDLPSPGVLSNSQQLRHQAANAISKLEVLAGVAPVSAGFSAAQLGDFFQACLDEVTPLITPAIPNSGQSTGTVAPSTVTEGTDLEVAFVATFRNAAGGALSGLPVTVTRGGTSEDVVTSAMTGVTDGEGKFTVTVSAAGPGTVVLTATSVVAGQTATATATLTVEPDAG